MAEPELLPGPPERRFRGKGGKLRRIWKLFVTLALIVVLVVASYAAYLYFFKFDRMLDRIATNEAVPKQDEASRKPIALLLLGLDSRPETGSLNTDVIMVAALNPDSKSAVIVSIPRDTYMKGAKGLPAGKANAYYAAAMRGSKAKADQQIKSVFGDWLRIPIDYAMTINFQGFSDVVDALGGITVDVDMDMRYVDKEDGTNIDLRQGEQALSGKQALDFVRYRKSNRGTAESSDLERNARQQKVVSEIIGKLKSFGGILKLGGVFDAVGGNMTTDIPKAQMKSILKTYLGINRDRIQYIHLDGDWRSPYIYVPAEQLAGAQNALRHVLE